MQDNLLCQRLPGEGGNQARGKGRGHPRRDWNGDQTKAGGQGACRARDRDTGASFAASASPRKCLRPAGREEGVPKSASGPTPETRV